MKSEYNGPPCKVQVAYPKPGGPKGYLDCKYNWFKCGMPTVTVHATTTQLSGRVCANNHFDQEQ